jgi:DNA-binding NtrC family response regulator
MCLPFPGEGDAVVAIHVESDTVRLTESSLRAANRFLSGISESVDLTSVVERAASEPRPFPHIVGNARCLVKELEVAERISRTDIPVLIQGESGTGKELVARAMHKASARGKKAFVAVNCSGLPESILDSELFGHEEGAFTGASSSRPGIFESADGGTLFLDEIADMSPSVQAKILRFVQFGEIRRIGSARVGRVDVRIIAATNRDLESLVSEGKFREDLYYRLNVVSIYLPPLRQRRCDVPLLIDHFIAAYAAEGEKVRISPAARGAVVAYDYPGNVRELENIVRRFLALSEARLVAIDHLPSKLRGGEAAGVVVPRSNAELKRAKAHARKRVTEELERLFLVEALERSKGSITRAAMLTGVNRSLLNQMVSKHGMDARDFSAKEAGMRGSRGVS